MTANPFFELSRTTAPGDFPTPGTEAQAPGTIKAVGVVLLVAIWAVLFASTWARWGDITIDNGREVYVPWELSQGKILYRDIWYPYTPGGPYLNSVLFRIFGPQLEVLYWAGSISALGCAILLYLTGGRLSYWFAGWTTATIVLIEAFVPNLFCFPLPYSYGAVYGALATCFFLWFAIRPSRHSFGWPLFASGIAASVALAFKPEFGVGCYVALMALIVLRSFQANSFRQTMRDLLIILPGILLSAAMITWMISLKGAGFITGENLMSWPTSYFMRAYGGIWLKYTGLAIDGTSLAKGVAGMGALVVYSALRAMVRRNGLGWPTFICGLFGVLALLALNVTTGWPEKLARSLLFPPSMVFLISLSIPFAFIAAWRKKWASTISSVVVLFIAVAAVSTRTLFNTYPVGYSIYYNGPVLLAFLLLADSIIFSSEGLSSRKNGPGRIPLYVGVLALACIHVAHKHADITNSGAKSVPLKTDRGVLYMSREKARLYAAAIDFMKAAASSGQYTMSIPEDTGLYFFSGTHCPTRPYSFTPGMLAPGKMTDQEIHEIDQARVRYLIWSNRVFPEYGVREFGTDFDQSLGSYFRSHYRPIRRLGASAAGDEWAAMIWERIPERFDP
jgi:hypothetical protein